MLVTDFGDKMYWINTIDNNKMMSVTFLTTLVKEILFLFTLASSTNIHKSSPTLSHQHYCHQNFVNKIYHPRSNSDISERYFRVILLGIANNSVTSLSSTHCSAPSAWLFKGSIIGFSKLWRKLLAYKKYIQNRTVVYHSLWFIGYLRFWTNILWRNPKNYLCSVFFTVIYLNLEILTSVLTSLRLFLTPKSHHWTSLNLLTLLNVQKLAPASKNSKPDSRADSLKLNGFISTNLALSKLWKITWKAIELSLCILQGIETQGTIWRYFKVLPVTMVRLFDQSKKGHPFELLNLYGPIFGMHCSRYCQAVWIPNWLEWPPSDGGQFFCEWLYFASKCWLYNELFPPSIGLRQSNYSRFRNTF